MSDIDLLAYLATAGAGRRAFNITSDVVSLSGSTEVDVCVFENPADSNTDIIMWYGEFGCSSNSLFRRYRNAVLATRGTAKVPVNMGGGSAAGVARMYPAGQFTLSSPGVVSKSAHIGSYRPHPSDVRGRTILRPGQCTRWTVVTPGGGSFTASVYWEFGQAAAAL
jgi:hypothetical protein